MITIAVGGLMFLLVLAHSGCSGQNPEILKTVVVVAEVVVAVVVVVIRESLV